MFRLKNKTVISVLKEESKHSNVEDKQLLTINYIDDYSL